jgi:hypothetical protein
LLNRYAMPSLVRRVTGRRELVLGTVNGQKALLSVHKEP